ncbi:hypothetical protein [Infirmifilum lucidum]|uniref:hypothetical protein n=1 Tax=Infirmifilum lucidum TaxID=2776706 RepID=UPI001CECFDB5|nr:hypothetical protein [Infirmifilum lucidum]
MGHTVAEVRLCNPRDRSRCVGLQLIVDTGSTYTWVRESMLESIGVERVVKRKFKTIEGNVIERWVGEAFAECMGEKATIAVVFAEEGDAEVLGVTALKVLGLEVDPVTGELRKSEARLALIARTPAGNLGVTAI